MSVSLPQTALGPDHELAPLASHELMPVDDHVSVTAADTGKTDV
jgi:hypothetical protein